MSMQFHHLPDGPPVFDTEKARARWAAARADYLAGGSGPEVCERHGLSLSSFRWRASKAGWRRADQPAPFLAPDAPAPQEGPLVIDTPEATSGTPAPPALTAAQMAAKAWTMLQAAVAAGRLIEARGWLRLHKELKPYARYEEMEAREAAARAAVDRPGSRETPADPGGVGLQLDSFSAPESDAPDLVRLSTQLAAVAQQIETAALNAEAGRSPDGFPEPESRTAAPPDEALTRLVAELEALAGHAERAVADEAARLQLHCFLPSESNAPGPGP